jgi:S-adenosylmethionine:tRNA ribosyltransferase-isomerase
MSLTLADFDYALPAELIAQAPLPQRSASRLLVVEGERHKDGNFVDLPLWLRAGDLLVLNDSRVLHARLLGRKESGGQSKSWSSACSIMPPRWRSCGRASRRSRAVACGSKTRSMSRCWDARASFTGCDFRRRGGTDRAPRPPAAAALHRTQAGGARRERYQTVYAREKGSVAAPTAGLHFDQRIAFQAARERCRNRPCHLHVGAGTFPAGAGKRPGAASHAYRALSSCRKPRSTPSRRPGRAADASWRSAPRPCACWNRRRWAASLKVGAGETALFVTPGFEFRVVDLLITNFHLPKSTLLMLVAAFAGWRKCVPPTATRLPPAIVSSAMGMPCCCTDGHGMNFELLATDGAARRGTLTLAHGNVAHAGLHAGGYLWHGQGHGAGRTGRHGRLDRARQYLPSLAAAGAGGDRRAWRPASLHGLGGPILTDSGGFQVFSLGDCARSARRASGLPRRSTAIGCS